MKCPKCGYLGFETTDRCRNCQYDFSLAPFSSEEPDLALRRQTEAAPDFELPPITRQTDKLSATALDLDRLFGEPETPPAANEPSMPATLPSEPGAPLSRVRVVDERDLIATPAPEDVPIASPMVAERAGETPIPEPAPEPTAVEAFAPQERLEQEPVEPEPMEQLEPLEPVEPDVLPFEEAPIVPPPAARPPLAVRRSTELPRNRPRTTRPVRVDSLNLEPAGEPKVNAGEAAGDTVASLMQMPSLGARVGAAGIDAFLMISIAIAVTYLTLRVTGLQNTLEDLRVLPPVPFVGFLATLGFGYVAAFTVAGGQTIGKMALSLRVIGDDGRPIDAAGGMLRALGCMLVPVTLGLSYLPAIFTSDHRALHDRLAGTRVVQE